MMTGIQNGFHIPAKIGEKDGSIGVTTKPIHSFPNTYMKTYYTEEAWHIMLVEDPRNPSFTINEITFQKTGDVLVVTEAQYSDISDTIDDLDVPDDDCVLLDGEEYYGDQQDVLDVINVYKVVDDTSGA